MTPGLPFRLLVRLLIAPACLTTVLLLALIPALLVDLAPFPITGSPGSALRATYELAFLDASLLSACVLHGCIGLTWLSRRLTRGARLALEASLLATATAVLTGLTLGLQALLSPLLCESPLRLSLALFSPICHLAALGLVLLRFDLSATVGPLVLLAVAWVLPAYFDIPLRPGPSTVATAPGRAYPFPAPSLADIAPMLAWFLAAWLLERQRPRS